MKPATKTTPDTIEQRRRALMAARTDAITRRDWAAMNEITKRLAKLPIKVVGPAGVRHEYGAV